MSLEKKLVLLMSIEVEHANTVRKEYFSFNLGVNSLADTIDKLRYRTRTFCSCLEKEMEHHRQEPLLLLCINIASTLDNSSFLMS